MVTGLSLAVLQSFGFADILLWLLTFAVVYGILDQAQVIKSKATKSIIGIVAGLFVLLAIPAAIELVFMQLSTSLLVLAMGVLMVVIFIELAGARHYKELKDEKGRVYSHQPVPFLSKHPYATAVVLFIFAALIFIASGAWQILGLGWVTIPAQYVAALIFLGIIAVAVYAMASEKERE